MKKVLVILIIVLPVMGCHQDKKNKALQNIADSTVYYPYTPLYTTGFDKGNDMYARSVLEIWRQYETGDVKHAADHFADSITIVFPDKFLTGKRDSILTLFQKRRETYTDLQSYVDSWMSVRAKDT